ncbi:FxDxF family PEP-CTERM protein [Rhodoferax sp.]|uniref:FxDxF family PEP-CTERM protein n=1 Tax=Rhodoferax sp. TaxID=50421 RepID=UPI002721BDC6|nr:FxDxF family PEP-CTERM protein [Rhodoferax sp.]MDO9197684.1 FxDxF family PEP-CTERM protein [Rhodoferax sp.]
MNIKALVSASILALSSLAASAASTSPIQVTGPSFADIELASFTLAETSDITGAVGFAPYVLIAPGFQIALPSVTFSSVSVYNTVQALTTLASWSGPNFTFSNLAAGTYSLRTDGLVGGTNFIGAQFTVTAVPEPETFAMLLAGLGLVGALARRRNKNLAA